jgi:serine/threonine protein kinase
MDETAIPATIGNYELRGTIGAGAFATVKLGYRADRDVYCAVKIILKSKMQSPEYSGLFERELRVFQQLRHPRVVQLYDLAQDDNFYYIMMEYCPNGELFAHIVSMGKLPEEETRLLFKDVMDALGSVHQLGIAHRDIKPENIFIDNEGMLKLGDFGLARYLTSEGLATTGCGSPCYTAPEVLSGKPYPARKSDMWSCGVLLFTMVTGQLPWTQRNQVQLFRQIRRGAYAIPKTVSAECSDLIRSLMAVNLEKRLDVPGVLAHPWMADVADRGVTFYEKPTVSLRTLDLFLDCDVKEKSVELGKRVASFRMKGFEKEAKRITGGKQSMKALIVPPTRTAFFKAAGLQKETQGAEGGSGGKKAQTPVIKIPIVSKAALLE